MLGFEVCKDGMIITPGIIDRTDRFAIVDVEIVIGYQLLWA